MKVIRSANDREREREEGLRGPRDSAGEGEVGLGQLGLGNTVGDSEEERLVE